MNLRKDHYRRDAPPASSHLPVARAAARPLGATARGRPSATAGGRRLRGLRAGRRAAGGLAPSAGSRPGSGARSSFPPPHPERQARGRAGLLLLLRTSATAGPGSGAARPAPRRSGTAASASGARSDGRRKASDREGRPTAARAREAGESERDARRRPGPSGGRPVRLPPPGGAGPGTPLAAPTPSARGPPDRPGPDGAAPRPPAPALSRASLRGGASQAARGPGLRAGPGTAREVRLRARAPARRRRRPRRRWPARASPRLPGGARRAPPPRPSAPPAPGSSHASRRLRPATERVALPLRLRLAFSPSRERARRTGPAPALSPAGASDRSEGDFRRPDGGRRGSLRPFPPPGAPSGCAVGAPSGRGRGRRRRVSAPEGRSPSSRSVSLPTTWPGTPDALRGGGSKPRAASRGEAGDRGAPPRLPAFPPGGRGASRAEGPRAEPSARSAGGETQLCSVGLFRGGPSPPPRGRGRVPPRSRSDHRQLLAVDHSARASMKNAASCEN